MDRLQDTIRHAELQCQQRGTRLTPKRKAVLAGLIRAEQALSAYELVDFCKTELSEALPVMSIYRILDFLEGEQLIHKLRIVNRYVACIHITCDHQHDVPQFLICIQCHQVQEISISQSTLKNLRSNVETAGYKLISPQLEMNCLCQHCSENC